MPSKERTTVLVVAAHPDDEVLGCGGTMARLAREGHQVHTMILGEGISSRYDRRSLVDRKALRQLQHDARAASQLLGTASITFEGLPDNRFDELPLLEIVKRVERRVAAVNPAVIYTHHPGDLNIDHRKTFQAVLTATRPVNGCRVRDIYAFEVPSSTEWAFQQLQPPFKPNVFVDVTSTMEMKVRGMQCYQSETRTFPHPRSPEALQAIMRRWGSVAGCAYAEAFELIRAVREDGSPAAPPVVDAHRAHCAVVFLGGKQAGCTGLLTLYGAGCNVLGVVAYDPQVRHLAETLGLPLFDSIRHAAVKPLLGQADLLVCVHGREVVPQPLLDLPKQGAINVHPCLYAYKGADPVARLLRDRNPKASVGVHRMEEQIDHGDVLVEEFVDVSGWRTAEEVYNVLYPLYATTLLKALRRVREGQDT